MAQNTLILIRRALKTVTPLLLMTHLFTAELYGGACDVMTCARNKKIDGALCISGSLIQKSCPPRAMFPLGSPRRHQKSYTGRIKLASSITGQQQDDVTIDTFFDIPLFLNVTGTALDSPNYISVENITNPGPALAINGDNTGPNPQDNGIAAAQIILDIGYECSPFACPPIVELNLEYGPEAPIDTFRTVLAPGPVITEGNLAEWINIQLMTSEITKTHAKITLLLYVMLFTGRNNQDQLTASVVNNFNTFLNETINRLGIAVALTGTYEPRSPSCNACS